MSVEYRPTFRCAERPDTKTLTPKQVAEILQVSPNHVYQLCDLYRRQKAAGASAPKGIPNIKFGACVRIPRSAVDSFLSLSQ